MTADGDEPAPLLALLDAIYHAYHYDFRSYARASLERRVAVALVHFGCTTIQQLHDRVLADPPTFVALLGFLTVQVSDFFRDPPYYRALREQVLPYLSTYPHFKIWVAGCATGEEAYSLAILLREEGLLERAQIYATDINPESLRIAEAGIYTLDRFPRFSDNYRLAGGRGSFADHYTAAYNGGVMVRGLRDAILFSDHSLATDVAFAEVQLVSCRNTLIYFDKALQTRAMGVLHDALCHRGFLGLGTKESLRFSPHAEAFTELAGPERIYRKA